MSPSLTIPRPAPTRARPQVAQYAAVIAFLALALPFIPAALRTPAHVARLEVGNGTVYGVSVEVLDHDGGRIPVGSLPPGHSATFREVADVGDRWTLVYAARGREVLRTVSRANLERSGWRTVVPDDLGTQLESAGEQPTP